MRSRDFLGFARTSSSREQWQLLKIRRSHSFRAVSDPVIASEVIFTIHYIRLLMFTLMNIPTQLIFVCSNVNSFPVPPRFQLAQVGNSNSLSFLPTGPPTGRVMSALSTGSAPGFVAQQRPLPTKH